jgi:YggT family protein
VAEFLQIFLRFLVIALWLVILGRVLFSWINPRFEGPVGRFLFDATEPMLAPIRRVLPQTGTFDLAPLILLIGLGVLMRLVLFL